jgi:hypothetical protein
METIMTLKYFFPKACILVIMLTLIPEIAFCELTKLEDTELSRIVAAGAPYNASLYGKSDGVTNTSSDAADTFNFNNENSSPESSYSPSAQNAPANPGYSTQFVNNRQAPS